MKRKQKALISFAGTAKLICVFVFAFAKSQFSHDVAHVKMQNSRNPMVAKFQANRAVVTMQNKMLI